MCTIKFGTNYSVRVSWCPRTFWSVVDIMNYLRINLLATYDWCNMNILQKVQIMPVIQSRYMEIGRTVLAIGSTKSTMGINPPWFCDELPEHDGYRTIMTCIHCFSKMVVLVPLCKTDAWTVASRFPAEVMSYHGLPATIISDRDPRF